MNIGKLARSDYFKLVPILGLAYYLALIPHRHYPYLVHLDEWIHLACSNQIITQGSMVGLVDPFSGGAPITNQLLESGFHIILAVFRQISGLSWLTIFRYFPGIIFMFTVLSVYILAKRRGFGWEAALLTCLIPTTIGILGPGFLVPVAMGLLFISLSLFIVFEYRGRWSYIALFILTIFLFVMHSGVAVGLITILIPYILLNLRGDWKRSIGLTLALTIPFLLALPWLFDLLVLPATRTLALFETGGVVPYVNVPRLITVCGYLPILLSLMGCIVLGIKGGKENYGLILGLLVLLGLLAVFFKLGYGISMMYYRGLQFAMLMMSIVAGAGLAAIKNLKLPNQIVARLKLAPSLRNIGYVLCLTLIAVTLYIAIPTRQGGAYYHMIDDEDYQAFTWVRENVDNGHKKAILDPIKATAFTAITGKNVYTWLGAFPLESDVRAYGFLGSGSADTAFLKENDVSIVYTRENVNNPDLVQVRKYVFLLKEE